jgi:hypothetical protein
MTEKATAMSAVTISPAAGTEFKNAIKWAVRILSGVVADAVAGKVDKDAWEDIEGAFEDFGRDLESALNDLYQALLDSREPRQ